MWCVCMCICESVSQKSHWPVQQYAFADLYLSVLRDGERKKPHGSFFIFVTCSSDRMCIDLHRFTANDNAVTVTVHITRHVCWHSQLSRLFSQFASPAFSLLAYITRRFFDPYTPSIILTMRASIKGFAYHILFGGTGVLYTGNFDQTRGRGNWV